MAVRWLRYLTTSLTILGASMLAEPPVLADGPAYVVKDVTDGSEPGVSSAPHGFVDLGTVVLFAARDDTHGNELWRTNGHPDGTALVADLAPGTADGIRSRARAVSGGVFYVPGPGGIWRSDGTATGTRLLVDVDAIDLVAGGDALYAFSAQDVLWRIAYADGAATPLGNFPNTEIAPSLTLVGDRLFFSVSGAAEELWTSDGTAAGTRLVRAAQLSNREGGSDETQLFAVGALLFFVARDDDAGWEVWCSDGTAAGTRRVRDIRPGVGNGIHFNDYAEVPQPFFAALGDTLLFMADDGVTGLELWRSDGTEEGTQRVTDLGAGALGLDGTTGGDDESDVAQRTIRMLPAAGRLFFTARPSGVALELWESDGTAAGTQPVARLSDDWGEVQSAAAGATLYISTQSNEGLRLWTSDGTAPGTTAVAAPYRYASELTPAFDGILFSGEDAAAGQELWRSDGTAAGTRRLADIARGLPGLEPAELTDVAGTLFFRARDDAHGEELWRSDGTAAGTILVADIAPGGTSSYPQELVASGSALYFSAYDGIHGRELWRSDGTDAGTRLVRDIAPEASDPYQLVADGRGGVYFFASQPATGYELWHSDGTEAGTHLVREIRPGPDGALPYTLPGVVFDEALLFSAVDTEHGAELWRSDGTEAGTVLVADLQPGDASSEPAAFTPLNDAVLFFAKNPSDNTSLWRTDGTGAGTVRVADVGRFIGAPAVADGRMLFATQTGIGTTTNIRLWQSDGTAAGTFTVGPRRFAHAGVAAAGTGLFAILDTGVPQLYRLDCGALLESPDPLSDLVGLGDRLLFTSPLSGGRGTRLWTSDGTAGGTVAVQELPAPPDDGYYRATPALELTRAGDRVFFVGDVGASGRELWALPVTALPVVDAPACPPPPTTTPRSTPGPFECPYGVDRCTVLELDAVDAEAGDAVTITATLHATDVPIAGTQSDVAFADGVAVATRSDGQPDCAVESGIDKAATGFAFLPPGCVPGASCTGLRALVLSLSNVDPIPDGARLFTCTLRVSPDAPPGEYPLVLSNLEAAEPEGFAVTLFGMDGAVTVRERSGTRPNVASAADTAGCQTTPRSAPAAALSLLPLALLWLRRRRR